MSNHEKTENDELFAGFGDIAPSPEITAQAVERTRQALLERAGGAVSINQTWWKTKTDRRSFAAVASVLAFVLAVVALPTFYSESGSTAFAQLREKLHKVRTITFDVELKVDGKPTEKHRQMIRDDGRSREEYSDGRYSVADQTEEGTTRIDVDPAKRTARMSYGFPQAELLDPIQTILDMTESAGARAIDPRQIDGRSCPGFVIDRKIGNDSSQQISLWIDPETQLPVYYVVVAKRKVPNGARPDGAVGTCSNFKYNVALEESLFTFTPPEGYTVTSVGSPRQRRGGRWPAEKLVLTVGEGIGPAKFGMSKEKVLELLGEPEERREPNQHVREGRPAWETERWWYNSQGVSITFSNLPEPGLYGVSCRRGSFRWRDFQGKTKEGIGLGSSPEEVRRAYGEPQRVQPFKDGLGMFEYHDKRMLIGFVDGKVHDLKIGRIPKNEPSSDE